MWQIYNEVDYCLYAGYGTKSEKGKMEYSILEPFFYGIPLIVEKDVIQHFKYEEYGINREDFKKSVILLNEENLDSIVNGTFDPTPYVQNARKIVEDFLPKKIIPRLQKALDYFKSDEEREKENFLFPFYESANC
jgi:hypothetical protein